MKALTQYLFTKSHHVDSSISTIWTVFNTLYLSIPLLSKSFFDRRSQGGHMCCSTFLVPRSVMVSYLHLQNYMHISSDKNEEKTVLLDTVHVTCNLLTHILERYALTTVLVLGHTRWNAEYWFASVYKVLTIYTLNNFSNWSLLFCCYLDIFTTNFVEIFSVLYRHMFVTKSVKISQFTFTSCCAVLSLLISTFPVWRHHLKYADD